MKNIDGKKVIEVESGTFVKRLPRLMSQLQNGPADEVHLLDPSGNPEFKLTCVQEA